MTSEEPSSKSPVSVKLVSETAIEWTFFCKHCKSEWTEITSRSMIHMARYCGCKGFPSYMMTMKNPYYIGVEKS